MTVAKRLSSNISSATFCTSSRVTAFIFLIIDHSVGEKIIRTTIAFVLFAMLAIALTQSGFSDGLYVNINGNWVSGSPSYSIYEQQEEPLDLSGCVNLSSCLGFNESDFISGMQSHQKLSPGNGTEFNNNSLNSSANETNKNLS